VEDAMKNAFLIGSKVYLRPLEKEDAPLLASWLNDPEITPLLLLDRPVSVLAEEVKIEEFARSRDDIVLGIAVRDTDRLIGGTGFHQMSLRNRSVRFGIFIGPKEEWGKGYGTEATRLMVGYAFEMLNLNRVWLDVYEYNTRGIHVYESIGFRKEGVLRQDTFRKGRYWDTIVMGILRQEWRTE
jgi:RimJ/RimL family protein N-acetyltransferase